MWATGTFEFICLEDIKKGLCQKHPGFPSSRKDAVSGQELKGLGHGRLVLTLQEWVCFDCHRSPPPPPFLPVELVMVLFTFPWPSLGQQDFYPAQNSLTLVRQTPALDSCNQSLSGDTVGIFSRRWSNSPRFTVAHGSFTWAKWFLCFCLLVPLWAFWCAHMDIYICSYAHRCSCIG